MSEEDMKANNHSSQDRSRPVDDKLEQHIQAYVAKSPVPASLRDQVLSATLAESPGAHSNSPTSRQVNSKNAGVLERPLDWLVSSYWRPATACLIPLVFGIALGASNPTLSADDPLDIAQVVYFDAIEEIESDEF